MHCNALEHFSEKSNVVNKKNDKKVTNLMLSKKMWQKSDNLMLSSSWNVLPADRRWCNLSIQIGIGLQFITGQDL